MGKYGEADPYFDRAYELDPDYKDYWPYTR